MLLLVHWVCSLSTNHNEPLMRCGLSLSVKAWRQKPNTKSDFSPGVWRCERPLFIRLAIKVSHFTCKDASFHGEFLSSIHMQIYLLPPWFGCTLYILTLSRRSLWPYYHWAFMLRFCKGKANLLLRAPYEEIVNFCWSISRAPRQWPGGKEAIAFVASMKYSKPAVHLCKRIYLVSRDVDYSVIH